MSEAVLWVEVVDPATERVLLAEELVLPADRAVLGERRALGLFAARFDGTRAVLELVAGPPKDGRPRTRWQTSRELDRWVPLEETVTWRDARWTVRVILGERWSPPPPDPALRCAAGDGPWVTARELRAELPDGTGYAVAAGVPVEPGPDGTARVQAGGLAFDVRVGEGDLGAAWTPTPGFPVGEAPLRARPGEVGATALGPVRWEGAEPLPVAGLEGARDPIATLRVACAEVRIRIDPTALVP